MIKFNKSLLEIKHVRPISFTSALGGSCRLVELVDGVEKEVRYDMPFAVARKLVGRYGQRMAVPLDAIGIFYNQKLICIDSFVTFKSDRVPGTPIEDTVFIADIRAALEEMDDKFEWCFDGRLVFRLMETDPTKMKLLTSDGLLRSTEAACIDLCGIRGSSSTTKDDEDDGDVVGVRECVVAYDAETNTMYPSSPIWANIMSLRSVKNEEEGSVLFDNIDQKYHLSMDFILATAEVIGYHFGYAHLRPLRIPELMVSLGTINLAKVDKSTRRRFISPFSIIEAITFLLGYLNKTNDLVVYEKIRQLLKHVLGRWSIAGSSHEENINMQVDFNSIEMIPHEVATDLLDISRKRAAGLLDDEDHFSEE